MREEWAPVKSHPMWVRGLKLRSSSLLVSNVMSHPMWVRGLKLGIDDATYVATHVAPYVGAWIETSGHGRAVHGDRVAPYVGAWIETQCLCR